MHNTKHDTAHTLFKRIEMNTDSKTPTHARRLVRLGTIATTTRFFTLLIAKLARIVTSYNFLLRQYPNFGELELE